MKLFVTLQYHPPTGACAYFPATDNLKMRIALVEDEKLLRLLEKVAKRIDELAESQMVFKYDAAANTGGADKVFMEADQ